ncbi:MAG: aldo/keto reductase [Chitinophagaceae bacterium]|nr:aldo/keto reductase [Chitinophagaceae bacterium]
MEYKQLGKSDLKISPIGYGCMSLHPGQEDFFSLIDKALDYGINYFDTADLYDKGGNEQELGKAFKRRRDKVIIASKAGNQWRSDGSGWDWNPRKDYLLKCAEESLRRLNTDYIDLFMLHGGTIQDDILESISAFEQLLKEGKIRYYGLSSIRPNVIRVHKEYGKVVSLMTQYSLLDRRPEETTLDLMKENNIGVLVRGSVASGLLVDKPAKAYLGHTPEEVANAAEVVKSVSTRERTPAQTAIQYVLHHPAVTSAVVGMRTEKQLDEAVGAISAPQLSADEITYLQTHIPAMKYESHR